MKALVRVYQLGISPMLTPNCRFVPSCSSYALEAYSNHPFWYASFLSTRRICRCHPWGGSGLDPVPPSAQQRFSKTDGVLHPLPAARISTPINPEGQ